MGADIFDAVNAFVLASFVLGDFKESDADIFNVRNLRFTRRQFFEIGDSEPMLCSGFGWTHDHTANSSIDLEAPKTTPRNQLKMASFDFVEAFSAH